MAILDIISGNSSTFTDAAGESYTVTSNVQHISNYSDAGEDTAAVTHGGWVNYDFTGTSPAGGAQGVIMVISAIDPNEEFFIYANDTLLDLNDAIADGSVTLVDASGFPGMGGAFVDGVDAGGAIQSVSENNGQVGVQFNFPVTSVDMLSGYGNNTSIEFTNLFVDTDAPTVGPDGTVDGAETGETMGVGYTDGQGDAITDGDDTIDGGAGNDTISGGDGNDSIDGGAGNDTIFGDAPSTGPDNDPNTGTFFLIDGPPSLGGTVNVLEVVQYTSDTSGNGFPTTLSTGDSIDGQTVTEAKYAQSNVFGSGSQTSVTMGDGTVLDQYDNDENTQGIAFQFYQLDDGRWLATLGGVGTSTGEYYSLQITDEVIENGSGVQSLTIGSQASFADEQWADNRSADLTDMGGGIFPTGSGSNGSGNDTIDGGLGADTIDGGAGDDQITVGAGDVASGGMGDDTFVIDSSLAAENGLDASVANGDLTEVQTGVYQDNNGNHWIDLADPDVSSYNLGALTADKILFASDPNAATLADVNLVNQSGALRFDESLTLINGPYDPSFGRTAIDVQAAGGATATAEGGQSTGYATSTYDPDPFAGREMDTAALEQAVTDGVVTQVQEGVYLDNNGNHWIDLADPDVSSYNLGALTGDKILFTSDPNAATLADLNMVNQSGALGFDESLTLINGPYDPSFGRTAIDVQAAGGATATAEGGQSTGYYTEPFYFGNFTSGASAITLDGGSENSADTLDVSGLTNVSWLQGPTDDGTGSYSGSFTYDNDAGETIRVNFTEIETLITTAAPDGTVDGAGTGETMGIGYTDGQGDAITSGDDVIEGNGGNDTITGGGGNDTIDGGAGNDSIFGDSSSSGGTLDPNADGVYFMGQFTPWYNPSGPNPIASTYGANTFGNNTIGSLSDPIEGGVSAVGLVSDPSGGTLSGYMEAYDVLGQVGGQDTFSINGGPDQTFAMGFGFFDYTIVYDDGSSVTLNATTQTGFEFDFNIWQDEDGNTYLVPQTQKAQDALEAGNVVSITPSGSVVAGSADSVIYGGIEPTDPVVSGDDTIDGGLGADTIDGGDGDDQITVGAGDVADGGSGDDTFILDPANTDQGTITINGEDETSADTLTGTGLTNLTWTSGPTDDGSGSFSGSLTYENVDGDTVTVNFSGIESFGGDLGPDGVVDGSGTGETMGVGYTDGQGDAITSGDDVIEGNGGNDAITAGDGNDSIDGGAGDDSILGDNADNVNAPSFGDLGNVSTLLGTSESFVNGAGDTITMDTTSLAPLGGGVGFATRDGLTGYALGDGTYDAEHHVHAFSDDVSGVALQFVDLHAGQQVQFILDGVTLDLNTAIADGTVVIDQPYSDYGVSGSGTLISTTGGDAWFGTVQIMGPFSTLEVVHFDNGYGVRDGETVYALRVYEADPDVAFAVSESGAGDDVIDGGLGADTIDGGAGDDQITVGAGDVADGGSGDDTFILDPSNTDQGTITINGEDEDSADTLTGTGLTNLTWTSGPTDDGSGSYSGSLTYENVDGETITVNFSGIESFGGDLGPDGVVDGSGTGETMGVGYTDGQGDAITDGDDAIAGNGGDDTIIAGGGNDVIDGGAGDDVIYGDTDGTSAGGTTQLTGPNGSYVNAAGDTVTYTWTETSVFNGDDTPDFANINPDGTIDVPNNGTGTYQNDGDFLYASNGNNGVWHEALEFNTLTFSGPVEGLTLDIRALNASEELYFEVDGQGINLQQAIADGSITITDNSAGYNITGSGTLLSGTADDSAQSPSGDTLELEDSITLQFNFPVSSVAMQSNNTGSTSGVLVGTSITEPDGGPAAEGGDDTIDGGLGADTIDGGAGDDQITVGAGDVADGGSGDDTFILDPSNTDQGTITINGEDEDSADTLTGTGLTNLTWTSGPTDDGSGSYSGSLTYENVDGETITVNFSGIESFGGDLTGDGIVDGAETGEAMGIGYTDTRGDQIDGDDGLDDSIRGNGGNDTIDAGFGNDTIEGGSGNDIIAGGAGDDEITGGGGADTIDGGTGDDTFYVDNPFAGDSISGGEGGESSGDMLDASGATNDLSFKFTDLDNGTLSLAKADNWISTFRSDARANFNQSEQESGEITQTGSFGDYTDDALDRYLEKFSWLNQSDNQRSTQQDNTDELEFTEIEHLVGGNGRDVLDLTEITTGLTVTYTGTDSGTISDGTHTITFSGIEEVLLSGENDTVIGSELTENLESFSGEGDDEFRGGKGNDIIGGGGGDDTLRGGFGDDYIEGGEGNDFLTTGMGEDTLIGGEGSDTLMNSMGDDSLVGGAGDDYIVASGGDDTLEGGAGNDTLFGGTQTSVADGATVTGTTGSDVFLWDGAAGESSTIILDDGSGDEHDGDSAGDGIYVSDTGNGATLTLEGFEVLEDRIFVSEAWTGSSSSTTGVNQTTITLTYASGNVQTFVINHDGAGAVGTGLFAVGTPTDDDSLVGGDDADTFLVENTFGNDVVIGGEGVTTGTDADVLDLTAMTDAVTVSFSGSEAGTITDGTDTITYSEIEEIQLGSGDDTVIGGAGNDSVSLGGGEDVFTLSTSGGADTIADFDINDDDTNGFFNDQLDVSALLGGTGPGGTVRAHDVVVTDDGSGNALLTFPSGEQILLEGVAPSSINTGPQLYSAGIPCFTPGTRIQTARGLVPVEKIRHGDLLQTADNGLQPVIWVGQRHLNAADLDAMPHLRPIHVNTGGAICSERPLLVSPQHRFVLPGNRALGDLNPGERFIRAKLLTTLPGSRARMAQGVRNVTYIHVLTERHEVIFAEGCATETFWPGPIALRGLTRSDQREVFDLFPELKAVLGQPIAEGRNLSRAVYGTLSRPDLSRRDIVNV